MRTGTRTQSGLRCAMSSPPRAPPRPGAAAAATGARSRPTWTTARRCPVTTSWRSTTPSPNTAAARATKASTTSSIVTSTPSARSEVTPRSAMPHGTMCPNMARSEVDVERDAVQGAAAARADPHRPHADGGDLPRVGPVGVDPDAGVLVHAAGAGQPEVGQRVDHHPLQAMHVPGARRGVVGHGDDRVGHQLARPVVGDVAPAVGALERRTDERRVDQHVALVGMGPERVGVRVLEEQEVVVVGLGGQRVLQASTPRGTGPSRAIGCAAPARS